MPSWGFSTVASGTINSGTVSAQLVAANPDRKYLRVQNESDSNVWLQLGTAAAVANEGVRVAAGAAFEMTRGQANVWSGAVQAIGTAASKRITYVDGS